MVVAGVVVRSVAHTQRLVRKPGAFARYRYREGLFPSLAFRQAYDAIHEQRADVRGDLEYLRILHLAAATMETEVEAALECLLEAGEVPSADAVRALVEPADGHPEQARWAPRCPELVSTQSTDGRLSPK